MMGLLGRQDDFHFNASWVGKRVARSWIVMLAKAGIQEVGPKPLDSRVRGKDVAGKIDSSMGLD
jgi:hypothetical protein